MKQRIKNKQNNNKNSLGVQLVTNNSYHIHSPSHDCTQVMCEEGHISSPHPYPKKRQGAGDIRAENRDVGCVRGRRVRRVYRWKEGVQEERGCVGGRRGCRRKDGV